jgi:DNA (cytosine-5)-methyltransferase 1
MRPRLLDLYCCEGGAAVGYYRAGFEVFGVDLFEDYSQKRYPFASFQGDALGSLYCLDGFDAIHASPPCQRHSAGTRAGNRDKYPDLIGPTRDSLVRTGLPYVIENVEGAPLVDPITLCGTMFGLTAVDDDGTKLYLKRHRLFESNVPLVAPQHDEPKGVQWAGSYGGARRDKHEARNVRHGGYVPSKKVQQELLGIDWMTQKGMHQSLPPAYTEYIGRQLIMCI